jgi:probable blue pigment (indigoidine) exporter
MRGSSRPPTWALLVLAAASWGTGTAISKQAVGAIPPTTLLTVQLAVSIGFLVVAGGVRGERLRSRPDERAITRLGLLNPGLAYALGLVGLTSITASLSVLIWAIEPILILGLAALLLRERVAGWLVWLSAVALVGLVVVVFDPAASGELVGIVISSVGVLCCAIYTIATRRWIGSSDSTVAVVIGQELWALILAIALVGAVALSGGPVLPASLDLGVVASAVVSGLLYYGVAYWLYLSALRHLPASIAATSFYLIPIFGLAAASLFGERLGPIQWLGAIAVVGAVAGVGYRQRRELVRATIPDGAVAA